MSRYRGTTNNEFDVTDSGPIATTDEIVDVAVSVLRELSEPGDSRTEQMARWIALNLGVPDRDSFPGVMIDRYDNTISLSEDHLEWWSGQDARLLAVSILRAVDRMER